MLLIIFVKIKTMTNMATSKEIRESIKTLKNIRQNMQKAQWGCMHEDCNDTAINSHLLQRHGILDNIIEDGHMFELRVNDMYRWAPNQSPIIFKRIGLNDAISHPLYCSKHDTELFIDIEKETPDLNNYRNLLLFSYRAICAEEFKKKFEAEYVNRILLARTLNFDPRFLTDLRTGYELGAKDLETMKNTVMSELDMPKNIFEFIHFEYPLFPIYASAIFSFETNFSKLASPELWDGFIVHIIPFKERLHVVFGYLKTALNTDMQSYLEKWKNVDKERLGIMLT